MKATILALLAGLAAPAALAAPTDVFIVGDGTAASFGPTRYPQFGWGMLLKCALPDEVTVHNLARPDHSARSFIDAGHLAELESALGPGDTVLIQWGHEDERAYDPSLYSDPEGPFAEKLLQFVEAVRARKAVPVLVTPVSRRSFEGDRVLDTHAHYVRAFRDAADRADVPLIDLTAVSTKWVQALGPEESKAYFLHYTPRVPPGAAPAAPVKDDNHLSELGARAVAAMVASELRGLDIPLAAQVRPAFPTLTRFSPVGSAACE